MKLITLSSITIILFLFQEINEALLLWHLRESRIYQDATQSSQGWLWRCQIKIRWFQEIQGARNLWIQLGPCTRNEWRIFRIKLLYFAHARKDVWILPRRSRVSMESRLSSLSWLRLTREVLGCTACQRRAEVVRTAQRLFKQSSQKILWCHVKEATEKFHTEILGR